MVHLFLQTKPIDIITVTEELTSSGDITKQGPQYVISLTEDVPIVSNALQYAAIVSDKAIQRRLIKAGGDIAKASYAPEGDVNGLLKWQRRRYSIFRRDENSKSYVKISDVLPQVYEEISELSQGKDISGIPYGISGPRQNFIWFTQSGSCACCR